MNQKAVIAMSGGVDSSVAAYLMKEKGYECIGITIKTFNETGDGIKRENTCCSLDDVSDARSVACTLGIRHFLYNFTGQFEEHVMKRFVNAYENGCTPNPCIDCNRYIKFQELYERAKLMGYDIVVTGHYARVEYNEVTGRYLLKKGLDANKDQSYVLYHLTQHQLAHTLMPLAGMEKSEARELAREAGLPVAHKPDSQEICFVQDNDYASFIRRYTGKEPPPGNFIDQAGNVLGTHKGITHYTIGQRKGLGISFGKPMFVTKIDPISNTVTLGENGSQYASSLIAGKVNLISADTLEAPISAQVKVRYQAPPAPARLTPLDNGKIRVDFQEPQRSVTPGQAAVFYDGDLVLGGGIIETV